MTEYNGTNRRRSRTSEGTTDGLIGRTLRDGVPFDQLTPRRGDQTAVLSAQVKARLKELFPFTQPLSAIEEFEKLVPVLARYQGQYDRLPEEKRLLLPWKIIEAHLLANGGALAESASKLEERGILFDIEDGKALFADAGENPLVMVLGKGVDYGHYDLGFATFRHTQGIKDHSPGLGGIDFYKEVEIIKDANGKPIPSGYKLMSPKQGQILESVTQKRLKARIIHTERRERRRRASHDSDTEYPTGEFDTVKREFGFRRVLEV